MATFSKQFLSGSTSGRPIQVAATSTPGTTIHQADASDIDEIWLFAVLRTGSSVLLTIEFGGTGNGDLITVQLANNSEPQAIVTGQPLTNSLTVAAFAGTTNVVNVYGFVNRIT